MEQNSPPGYAFLLYAPHRHGEWPCPEDALRVLQLPPEAVEAIRTRPVGDGLPCCWLDPETKRCRWHEHRPQICRDFEPGSQACAGWRADAIPACSHCLSPIPDPAERWPDGKGGWLCQMCWEDECGRTWWKAVDAIAAEAAERKG